MELCAAAPFSVWALLFTMCKQRLPDTCRSDAHPCPLSCRQSSGLNRVILDSMTIVLPVACFAPLHALAMVGGLAALSSARSLNPDWVSLHDESLDGLSAFNVSRLVFNLGEPKKLLTAAYHSA